MRPRAPASSLRPASALLVCAAIGFAAPDAWGVTQLRRGDAPPAIKLGTVSGERFRLADRKGRCVVLVFGELYHERSLAACRIVAEVLADPRSSSAPVDVVLIVAQQAEPQALRKAAQERGVAFPVLHDRDRTAFAAYQVSVLPSVVVIDPQGRVVHALAGLSPAFRDVVTDAVLFAAGRLSGEQLARTLHPTRGPAEAPGARRAARLTELGKQLSRSGMHDLAAEKFREALTVDPRCAAARVGLGRGAIQRRRLAEAEGHFRGALEVEPGSTEAALGLAAVLAMRGGGELPQAEQHVRNVLARRPNDAEAHYLLGVILEESGKTKESMASYRKSAELLLERGGNE